MNGRIKIAVLILLAIITGVILIVTPIACKETEPNYETGVKPPSYYIKNMGLGKQKTGTLTLMNGTDESMDIYIEYRYPDNIDPSKGYGYPPQPARDWVTIDGNYLYTICTVPPNSTKDIPVVLAIPSNAFVPNDKWVFWIWVTELDQNGMVDIAYGQQWFVSMR